MPIKDHGEVLKPVFQRLRDEAKSKDLETHESFNDELENYSRHKIVNDLPVDPLRNVITHIGRYAVDQARKANSKRVGGGHVREAVNSLCDDPFSTCSRAASRIIEDNETVLKRR
jgi:hypothetical protein